MNTHIIKSLDLVSEIRAVLFAVDAVYLENAEDNLQYLFQIIEDLARSLQCELMLLQDERRMIDRTVS